MRMIPDTSSQPEITKKLIRETIKTQETWDIFSTTE